VFDKGDKEYTRAFQLDILWNTRSVGVAPGTGLVSVSFSVHDKIDVWHESV